MRPPRFSLSAALALGLLFLAPACRADEAAPAEGEAIFLAEATINGVAYRIGARRIYYPHIRERVVFHLADASAVVGKVAMRTLIAGQPIPIGAVRDAYVITQGKTATVIFEEGGLTLSAQAVALSNGGIGDMISLRNPESGVTIKGTVAPDGTIRLGGP